jgi:hypothetical protein
METVEVFDRTRPAAAAPARLRNWLSGTGTRAARQDGDRAPGGAEEARLAREAADRACYESSAPPEA